MYNVYNRVIFANTKKAGTITLEKIKITDGITLNIINTDKFKTNYLSFNFVTPLSREKVSYYALIPQVLMRGTKSYNDLASIKNKLDDLYAASVEGRVYRRGEYQICGITASWLMDKYAIDGTNITDGTLDVLEEIIFTPFLENGVFSNSYVESEKKNLIDDIRAIINNKNGYAIRRCQEEMCKDEAFGICEYGEEAVVESITSDELYRLYNELLETARVEIFYVGSGDMDKLCEKISKMFVDRERRYSEFKGAEVRKEVLQTKEVLEKCATMQGKLSLGFRTGTVLGEDDYNAFPVFVEMYGNSPVSKLFMNVREKLSLCYYCRAIPEGIKGVMVVTSGIEVSKKQEAQDEILAQLECVRNGEFTEDELILAKKSLKNAYDELNDSPASVESWYLTRRLAGVDDETETVARRFMDVTREDVIRVAKKIKLDTVYFLEGTMTGEVEDDDE